VLGTEPSPEVKAPLELPAAAGLLAGPELGADTRWVGLLDGHGVPVDAGAAFPLWLAVTVPAPPGPGVPDPLALADGSVLGEGSAVGEAVSLGAPDGFPAGAEEAGAEVGPVRDVPGRTQGEAAGLECRVPPVEVLVAPGTRPDPAVPPGLPPFGLVPLCAVWDVLSAPEEETT
jgi:hypothetical protein